MSQFNSSIENPQSCGDDVAENLAWEPQGPVPQIMNNGARRPVLVITSDDLALWLGYNPEIMGRLVVFQSFWMTNKQVRGIQYVTTIYRPKAGVAVPVWSLVVVIAGLIYTAGMTMQKLDYVIASTSKIEIIQQRVLDMQIIDSNQTTKIEANTKRLDKLEESIGTGHAPR